MSSLNLIHGPPNSGRAARIQSLFSAALDRDPVLVVPTADDVFRFERSLCGGSATLGGSVMTFEGLFRTVAGAGGTPPGTRLSDAQRLRAVAVAIARRHGELGPLRHSSTHPGFATAFERLLDELQGAGLQPQALDSSAGTLEASAYLGDLAKLFSAYVDVREGLGRMDAGEIARAATALLRNSPEAWGGRPVFFYEPGDLTHNQRELIAALVEVTEVTLALPHEEGNAALSARASLLERLRAVGAGSELETEPDPSDTEPLLFHLQRGFGAIDADRRAPDGALALLRSAGERGEAESIGAEVATLLFEGVDPDEIAIALRDPARRGPLIASVLESYGIAVALEAEIPVASTSVGGTLIALLESEHGTGRAADLLRFMRGPSGLPSAQVDWFERAIRRRRVNGGAAALQLWMERNGRLPGDVTRIREAAAAGPAALAQEAGRLAATMASRPLRGEADGPRPGRGDGLELRAAARIAAAFAEISEPHDLAPSAADLATTIADLRFLAWSGPVEGRVRIASPYRLRTSRFDHVFVGSLQDGEFPRRDRGEDPFLSEPQRLALGLEPRRDPEAEERYLFHACLALPRRRIFLSFRDSDENGVAEARSPFIDDVRRLLDPPPGGMAPDPVEAALTVGRDLAQVVHRVNRSPSEAELARAIAARGPQADAADLLEGAGAEVPARKRVAESIEASRAVEAATRAPGPISNPAVIEALAAVTAYGGTTLEGFDVCSYRWFVSHELDPQPLDPAPDPLIQGGLMHRILERLYTERPGGDPLPRPGSLWAWIERGRGLVGEIGAEDGLGGHPAERAIASRVEGLLVRFLGEEAGRKESGFEPWLLEASFGEAEDAVRPLLAIDDWNLHGAIDRVDRAEDGRAVVIDYKLARTVTPREKFEEQEKLQLQLYLIAIAEHWGADPVGGLYHPLRGTSNRRPRGAVLEGAAGALASYDLYDNDLVDAAGFEKMLDDARRRAGQIVARMRSGEVRRDPGPGPGLRGHDICPSFCDFAPICRRDRAPEDFEEGEVEDR
jgi:PD-(D/E)XK nuclease superfamily